MNERNLILIRHGQSEWNEKNLFTGWENPGLTEKGEKEAKNAGDLIKSLGINFNYMFTQRFGLTLGTTVIDATIDNFPTMVNFMIGGRLSF